MPVLEKDSYEIYCHNRVAGKDKTECAILAGFSKKSATTQGHKLSIRPEIIARIAELKEEIAKKAIMDLDEIATGFAIIARDKSETTKNRLTAYRYAGEMQGAFIQKIEQTGPPPVIKPVFLVKKPDKES